MKSFIEHIQKSIFGPEYYQELLSRPAAFSWKYYGSLAMLLALFLTIVSSISLVPLIGKTLNNFPAAFLAYYPDELQIRIINGQAGSTVAEPYFLPIPEILKDGIEKSTGATQYFGVIDTQSPASLERFQSYNVYFWIAKNALIFHDQKGGLRITPFDPNFNYTVNEQILRDLIGIVQPFFKFVAPVVVLIVFIAMLFMFAIELVYLIFAALLVFILARLLGHRWTFGASYRVSLHAVTFPLVLSVAFSLVHLDIENLPFLSTVLLLAVVYINLRNISSEPPVVPDPAPSPVSEGDK